MRKLKAKNGVAAKLALLLALTAGLAGCGSTGSSTSPAIQTDANGKHWTGTVKVVLEGNFKIDDSIDPIAGKKILGLHVLKEEFEKEHPGAALDFIVIPWDNYVAKLETMVKGGQADVYENSGPLPNFAQQGLLEPLQPYIDKDKFDLSVYFKGQVEGWKVVGSGDRTPQIYGLPEFGDTELIGYDKKLFDQWHVSYLSAHPTMDEILQKAKQMTGKNPVTGQQNYGAYIDASGNSHIPMMLANLAEAQDGNWGFGNTVKDMQLAFDSPQWMRGMQWLKDIAQYTPKGIVSKQGAETWLTPENDIAININIGPSNLINTAQLQNVKDRLGLAEVFKNSQGVGGAFYGAPFVIGKSSNNKDLAWEFIKFSSSDFYQRYMYNQWGNLPVVKSSASWDEVKNEPLMKPILDALGSMTTPAYVWGGSQPRFILAQKIQAVLTGSLSPDQALKQAQQESMDWVKQQK